MLDVSKYKVTDSDAVTRTLRPLTLRERLASLRAMFDLSQTEAGQLVGASRNAWGAWEAEDGNPRKTTPSGKHRQGMSQVFGLPQSLFVED